MDISQSLKLHTTAIDMRTKKSSSHDVYDHKCTANIATQPSCHLGVYVELIISWVIFNASPWFQRCLLL